MSWLNRIWNSLSSRRLRDEVRQELETHLGMLEDAAVSQGSSASEARAQARKQFGSLAVQTDRVQDVSLSIHLHELAQDVRFAFRQMRRRPGFAIVAVLITAFGISSATTIFSLVNAVLFHSLPYKDPSRLVYLWTPNPRFGANVPREIGPSYPDALEWEAHNRSFSSMAMIRQRVFNVSLSGMAERRGGASVSSAFFQTLGVQPKLGRSFALFDSQPEHDRVAIISDRLWRQLFAGQPSALGKSIQLDRLKYKVIGIMPEEFGYPFEGDIPYGAADYDRADVWVPMVLSSADRTDRINPQSADALIARLRQNITVPEAQRELASTEKRLNLLYAPDLRGWTVWVNSLRDTIIGPVRTLLWTLLAAVAVVLLIACGNVSNLLLARTTARMEEITIRVSLGAGRGRLIRQMLTESVALALSGCLLGVILSLGAVRLLLGMNPGNIPRFDATAVNWPVLLVSILVSICSGVLFGLVPALLASRINLKRELNKGGNKGSLGTSRLAGQTLIAAEVALSFGLLIAAGLLIRSYIQLQNQNPGYLRSTLTMNLQLDSRYSKPEQRHALFLNFLQRLHQMPGVLQAGAGDDIPLDRYESLANVEIKGFGRPKELIDSRVITPGYLAAFGTNLVAGRSFNERDMQPGSGAVIVNQAFVKAFLAGRDPLTVQVRSGSNIENRPWEAVVGVVGDRRHSKLEEAPRPEYYRPYLPSYDTWNLHFAIHSLLPANQVALMARNTLRQLDPDLALDDIHTMEERMADANARRRFQTILLSTFGLIAILLALGGIYGVLMYSVRQRTREMGLRMALGAKRLHVFAMILKQGLSAVVIGLVLGIIAAFALTRFISSWLYGVPASDPLTYTLLSILVLLVATAACLIPAFDAMRVDPVVAIRDE